MDARRDVDKVRQYLAGLQDVPRELYEVQFPAPGNPELAQRVRQLLAPIPVALDQSWGLDHGTWSVLRHVFPEADVPVIQLSIDETQPAEFHYETAKRLTGLRDENAKETKGRQFACPSCGRDNVGVWNLAEAVEGRLKQYPQHFEVAVLGCAVNGPGEAGDADFGIAGGRDVGFIYAHGRVLKKVSSEILIDELFHEIDRWIAAKKAG